MASNQNGAALAPLALPSILSLPFKTNSSLLPEKGGARGELEHHVSRAPRYGESQAAQVL